jgi:two-component system, sensor histidine kinase and response regulator
MVNQMVAKGILKKLGLIIDVANNGIEALQCLKNTSEDICYHVILMDCQMPEMDGYDATRKIRAGDAGERNKRIPIIAMTANAMLGDKETCMMSGMSDYLSKPVDSSKLYSKLSDWVKLEPFVEV